MSEIHNKPGLAADAMQPMGYITGNAWPVFWPGNPITALFRRQPCAGVATDTRGQIAAELRRLGI